MHRTPSLALCITLVQALSAVAPAQAQTTWYVDDDGDVAGGCTTWADACPELQIALSLANAGNQIWVATGSYTPDYDVATSQHTGDREATFQLISGVAIYGGFAGTESTLEDRAGLFGQTILTGDLNGDDGPDFENNAENSFHVTLGDGTNATAILDGFAITAGNANGTSLNNGGGGMQSIDGSPTVANCTFGFNSGGAGAGMRISDSNTTMVNCLFKGNRVITVSGGGGMVITGGSHVLLINCLFSGNSTLGVGGGIYVCCSSASLANCAFSGNSAQLAGGAILTCCSGDITLRNSILWDNTAPMGKEIALWSFSSPSSLTATYCDVQGGEGGVLVEPGSTLNWGEGNIDADPLFVDPENVDFHLLHGSPCIDAGNNLALREGVTTDLDGDPRFLDDPDSPDTGNPDPDAPELPIIDMGPYEFDRSDCNNNDVPDKQDLADRTSDDCNANGVPDDCELDCNANGQQDDCDIADEVSEDCDANGVPDECQIDCNANGEPDACDIAEGIAQDCGGEGIPDDCPENPGPTITQQPATQEVDVGDFAFFVVGADGLLLEYQWRKDGVDLSDSESIIGTDTPALIILDVVPGDAGGYDCVVTDFFGACARSNEGVLTVIRGVELVLDLDIRPGSCPNPLNRHGNGVLPVGLIGTPDFNPTEVDLSTLQLSRADGVGGSVAPNEGPPGPHSVFEDVATPFDGEGCECHDLGGDGIDDLSMKFKTRDLVDALELDELPGGAVVELVLSGSLLDGTPFVAGDCIVIVPPGDHGPINATVGSNVGDTFIKVTPLDLNIDSDGFTSFGRAYYAGTLLTVTAPPASEGRRFVRWMVDGVLQEIGVRTIEVAVAEDTTLQALYHRQRRLRPDRATESDAPLD